MPKILVIAAVLGVLAAVLAIASPTGAARSQAQEMPSNQCVQCHAQTNAPPDLAGRYLDWHFSKHAEASVGCERCHGGDPTAKTADAGHKGMLPPSNPQSRLHRSNLPTTCGACHQEVVNSFVESLHFKRLQESGLGPNCTTCHEHMASAIATSAIEAASYCTTCHNSYNGLLERRPEIPRMAENFMTSLSRANYTAEWASDLLDEAQRRNVDVAAELDDMRLLQGLLYEARVGWHGFGLDGVQTKVDKAFVEGIRIRESVQKKLAK